MSWFSDFKDDVVQAVVPHEINPGNNLAKIAGLTAAAVVGGPAIVGMMGPEAVGYTLAEGAGDVALGTVGETGAFDMWGAAVSPGATTTIFDGAGAAVASVPSTWLSSLGTGAQNVINALVSSRGAATAQGARPANTVTTKGQRSDVAPLAGTWGFPGQGTTFAQPLYQPVQTASAMNFLPWILAAFVGMLFIFLIARR